jgi:peptide/nickel transport system permease protein
MVVMLAALSVIVFVTIELPPGDYADRRALDLRSQGVSVTQQDLIALRHQFGLDRPWYQRYVKWITDIIFHGNFGISFGYHRPVADLLAERVGLTVMLAIATIIFTYGLAIPIGIYSAIRQYSLGDYAATIVGYFGMATPSFMLALILLYFSVMVFNNSVGGLFSSQYAEAPWSWAKFVDLLRHLWVPALVLGLAGTAFEIRTMRATMLDEKNKLYVTAARAKGLPEWKLLMKYPVRVALNPIASTIGWELTAIIAGAPLVSFVLALPDTGPLFLRCDPAYVLHLDHPGYVSVGRVAGGARSTHPLWGEGLICPRSLKRLTLSPTRRHPCLALPEKWRSGTTPLRSSN